MGASIKDFFADVWSELREKRLWPVAALLGVGLIAAPVLLLKGKPEPPAPETASVDATSAQVPAIDPDPSSLAGSSRLGAFGEKNPFRPHLDRPRGAGADSPFG